jgi:hypothetical protein
VSFEGLHFANIPISSGVFYSLLCDIYMLLKLFLRVNVMYLCFLKGDPNQDIFLGQRASNSRGE